MASSSLSLRVALVLLATLSSLQLVSAAPEVPNWGIAVIVIGSLAVIAAVIIPIACCCACDSCETWDTVPTSYPRKDDKYASMA